MPYNIPFPKLTFFHEKIVDGGRVFDDVFPFDFLRLPFLPSRVCCKDCIVEEGGRKESQDALEVDGAATNCRGSGEGGKIINMRQLAMSTALGTVTWMG